MCIVACGGKPPVDPTPVANPPQITCPADVAVRGVPSPAQSVAFDPPVITGGTAPVQVACTPASGSAFPLGANAVGCLATDAASRTATCSFKVTLTGFAIALTKYEAFGDSLTVGEVGRPSVAGFNEIDVANAYPTKLQARLDAVYPNQGIVVLNRGESGNVTTQTDSRVRAFAAADRPEVVLLLTGYNNLQQGCGAGVATPVCRDAIRSVGDDVRSCIRHAREVDSALQLVFVSTLTPPGAAGSNRIDRTAIVQANQQIQAVAAAERAVLVDAYAAFVGHEADYVNVDGLHLKPAGYQALADAFFAAIQGTVKQTPLEGRR
jgi:lysophospholipase L1-like esterase